MSEYGKYEVINGVNTYYNEAGEGDPLLLIHGSGPGVSAWANWNLVFPIFSKKFHLYAPDLIGFGSTDKLTDGEYGIDVWVNQMIGFIEAKKLQPVSIVGNSLGGCIALHIAHRRPDLVKRIVMMGSSGTHFKLTEGLDRVWGYTPSFENMKKVIDVFSYDTKFANDSNVVQMRYEATIAGDGINQKAFESMFPAPRQRHVDAMALSDEQLKSIETPSLFLHGREDLVVPIEETSWRMANLLPNAEMHMFSKCGHWTQIEHAERFNTLVADFLKD